MKLTVKTELIENYRKENNLTVHRFCKKCDISEQTYYKFMNGQLNLRLSIILKILRTMNVRAGDIIEVTDD